MKKRLRGTIALLIAFCVAFTGLPFLAGNLEANALAKKKKLPKNITLQVAANGQTQAVLKWNKIKSPSKGYAVFRNGEVVKHFNTKKIAFTDSDLKAGTTYTYQIKTYTKKKVRMWFNKKTEKWQKKKPAKKYRGKSRKETVYTYKKKSNAVTVHTAAAPAPANPTDTGDSGSNGGSNGNTDPVQTTYTITWKNWNGETLATSTVEEGKTPTYSGNTPSKPTTTTATYTFNGWSPTPGPISANTTYTAQFKETKRTYTITWVVNGSSTTTTVNAGDMPVYNGTPTKPAANGYKYTFAGWSPTVVAAAQNATYTAQFNQEKNDVSPLGYTYKIHFLNEPYGHGGRLNVYVETNNPNRANYTISLQNASNQTEQPNILKTIYNGGNSSSYRDLDLSKIHGCIYICSPNYVGNGALLVQEIDRTNGTRKIVASRSITLKDYYTEEHEWMQSVINQTTTSSMTNKQKMYEICDYIEHSFTYSLNDGWDGTGYIDLIVNAGIPYWKSKTADSSSSPAFLVKFGTLLGYQLHNCYADYPQGSTEWENYHMCAYSELDNTYYQCCPDLSTGTIDPNTITIFEPDTYQFWGE